MRQFSFRSIAMTAASAVTIGVMAGAMASAVLVSGAAAQQGVVWVPGKGAAIPKGAVAGGREAERVLYICRAQHSRGVHPGKLVAGKCNIGYGGREIVSSRFELMVNRSAWIRWVTPKGAQVPKNAFIGGKEPGRSLFVCRAMHNKGMHPGKVVAGKCNIGWGGKEIVSAKYQVMVIASRAATPPAASLPKGMTWAVARGTKLPTGTVLGGYERGKPVYICRAPSKGGLIPGKLVGRRCIISNGGREVSAPKYQILVRAGQGVKWVPARSVKDLRTAFPGGAGPRVLNHVCAARHGAGRYPGRLVNGVCYIAYGAKEIPLRKYSVLVNRSARYGWVPPAALNNRPAGPIGDFGEAVSGGAERGQNLYICRGSFAGGMLIGKVYNKACHVGYYGRAHKIAKYHVMVAK